VGTIGTGPQLPSRGAARTVDQPLGIRCVVGGVDAVPSEKSDVSGGQCLLILDLRHATRPDQLSAAEWASFCADLHRAETAVVRAVRPDHINIVSLGNVVPHLHWHIIPRYRADPRWGGPIWPEDAQHRLTPAEEEALIVTLKEMLVA
jgi:diadenosine tetraphosphate (Ap4A) HIT family hydrolase